ncbi:MAG: esterase/lipase family protein [Verrucomicrobiia bacterium]
MHVHSSSPQARARISLKHLLSKIIVGCALAAALGAGGCSAPIGIDRVSTRQAYAQVQANALQTGKPGANTLSILHRYDLDRLAEKHPDDAVRQLHQKALSQGGRDELFALAELSYAAGEHIRRSVKAWDKRDARDYYLGAAVYAWLYLFGRGDEPPPGSLDRRLREACDFYNYSLGLALLTKNKTNAVVRWEGGRRQLPVGEIEIKLDGTPPPQFERIVLADQHRVRGLSVRTREPGVGAPVICVGVRNPSLGYAPATPATVLLRGPDTLADITVGRPVCRLELFQGFDEPAVMIGQVRVPLENDLTAYRAYTLTQPGIWKLGKSQFLAPAARVPNQLMLNQPFSPERIPVVFVHGTLSSPVTWAEAANSLMADPTLRRRFQVWSYIYGSGNPLLLSIADLRDTLAKKVQEHDPQGTNAALRNMVVIGHSQGGLLAKCTAIQTGDLLWRLVNTNRLKDTKLTDEKKEQVRRVMFYEPLPFVKRVVFIATPHRGSYLSSGLARRLARSLVRLPGGLAARGREFVSLSSGSAGNRFWRGQIPTSLDGMSPENPGLLAIAELPLAPGIKAHSIIPVVDPENFRESRDGVVTYASAHLENVESELVVAGKHSCLNEPATIEEVRRILYTHLDDLNEDTDTKL